MIRKLFAVIQYEEIDCLLTKLSLASSQKMPEALPSNVIKVLQGTLLPNKVQQAKAGWNREGQGRPVADAIVNLTSSLSCQIIASPSGMRHYFSLDICESILYWKYINFDGNCVYSNLVMKCNEVTCWWLNCFCFCVLFLTIFFVA